MTTKQMKLNELKAMVRAWKKEKGLTLAYDICEFLANNLDLEEAPEPTEPTFIDLDERIKEKEE